MISSKLDLMASNFMYRWANLVDEDKLKGIPATLIAEWIQKDIEVVNIFMPLIGWRKLILENNTYWFNSSAYDELLRNVEILLVK